MAVTAESVSSPPPEFPARALARPSGPLRLFRGGVLAEPAIAYETWGRLDHQRSNALVLFTGLSPSAHAASSPADPSPGWWESMIGPGRPIDTDRYFVICVNSIGSPFGSSSPASIDPRTQRPYGLGFPEVAVEDLAAGGRVVLRALGITRPGAGLVTGVPSGAAISMPLCGLRGWSLKNRREPYEFERWPLTGRAMRSSGTWSVL